jgi:hypothetical protein
MSVRYPHPQRGGGLHNCRVGRHRGIPDRLFGLEHPKGVAKLRLTKVWANFGFNMAFCVLFLTSWMGHAIMEWQLYVQEQQAHDEPIDVTGQLTEFALIELGELAVGVLAAVLLRRAVRPLHPPR